MSTATTSPTHRKESFAARFLTSGWLWGTALTVCFYCALPSLPIYRESAQRYFTAHWIEYATTGLFFVGMATLVVKALRIPAERAALQSDVLVGLTPRPGEPATSMANHIEQHLKLVARQSADSIVVRRIRELCEYVRARCTADGLEGHLTYLAELSSGRLHESYALIRTITWAVPILGFLGTVIGITMAIANVTPDQLSSSLNDVTAGLAVAFDTTALSLALSMILVFSTFVVEQSEQRHLDGVEDFLVQRLNALFPADSAPQSPLLAAESVAAERLLQEMETLIHIQQEEWRQSLQEVRQRWCDTLERQQQQLAESLQTAATQTLGDHAQQLADLRTEFAAGLMQGSQALAERWAEMQQQSHADQADARQELAATWAGFRDELQSAAAQQVELVDHLAQTLTGSVSAWQTDLREATASVHEQLSEIRRHGELLARLADQEAELINLEERLARNLESVRVANSLEETMLNLNAAVHLLTARTIAKAA
jgi:biopolymer transport protein ExbB/TolQ